MLAPSDNGRMVADYIATAFTNGKPFGIFAVAKANSGSVYNQAMYTTKDPLLASADEPRFSSKGEKPVAKSPYVRKYYDDDGEYPIPSSKQLRTRIPSSKQQ